MLRGACIPAGELTGNCVVIRRSASSRFLQPHRQPPVSRQGRLPAPAPHSLAPPRAAAALPPLRPTQSGIHVPSPARPAAPGTPALRSRANAPRRPSGTNAHPHARCNCPAQTAPPSAHSLPHSRAPHPRRPPTTRLSLPRPPRASARPPHTIPCSATHSQSAPTPPLLLPQRSAPPGVLHHRNTPLAHTR